MSFEIFIGGRYLRAKQKQTFISLITFLSIAGVTVGVMALIVVIAVMAGFESDLKTRILGIESHLVIARQGGAMPDYRQVLAFIDGTQGVQAATPFVATQIMLRSASSAAGAVLRGIDPDTAGGVISGVDSRLLARPADGASLPGILLGRELARNLGVFTHDTIYLIAPRGMLSPVGHVPAMKRFQVAGVFATGMYEYDGSLAFISLEEGQKLLHLDPGAASGIELRVADIYAVQKIAGRIRATLGPAYVTRDWMEKNQNLLAALTLEKTVMFIILTLIVLVAAFNIAGSLIMMVMEKAKDIAILKTMGATDGSIRKIFVFKGMMIGAFGTLLGVALGFGLCFLLERYKFIELPGDVYYITTLPVRLEGLDVVLIALAALAICFLATLYPARQASRLDPVEALRHG
jgi:lipoprotein-releasing system permease protein